MHLDYSETTLGQLLSFANGRSSPERDDTLPFPVYGSNGVIGHAAETNADSRSIIIGRVGSYCGSLQFSSQPCWITDNAIRATAVADNDSKFLFYLLTTLRLNSRRAGSGQPLLNQEILGSIPALVPPPKVQRAIAHVLGSLDGKIELNRQTSETLDAMARALYKSWFVDFDPVRAKAEGRDPRVPKSITDMFPDRLVESERGEIPEGWAIGELEDAANQVRDQVDPSASPGAVFRHFSIPAFDDDQSPKLETSESIKSHKSRVPAASILLSKLNPEIERVWLVDVDASERAICSTEFIVLHPRRPFGRAYIYCLVRSQEFRQKISSLVTGTSKSHQRAPTPATMAIPVILPPTPAVEVFEQLAAIWLDRSLACRRESRILASLRDALLPKLSSGQLRIKDAERILAQTAA